MGNKVKIVGVRDFISKQGKPMRQLFCTCDAKQTGLIGITTCTVFVFEGSEYFEFAPSDFLNKTAKVIYNKGDYILASIPELDK